MADDNSIIADLKTQGFDEMLEKLKSSATGFGDLAKGIEEAKKKLSTLADGSPEFKKLSKEIDASTVALKSFTTSSENLNTEIRKTKQALVEIEDAMNEVAKSGGKNTDSYRSLQESYRITEKEVKSLTDRQKALNASLSDTKGLDTAIRGIGLIANSYQLAQGALALLGGENKKFEQTLLKINAVMAVTQSLQHIQNELTRQDSVLKALASRATAAYTFVTNGATAALVAFRAVMVTLGIGAFVAAIGYLVANWDRLKVSIFGVVKTIEDFNKEKEKSIALSKKELEALDKELEYQTKIKGLSEAAAKQKRAEFIATQLEKETKELQKQTKLYEDLKKKREEQGVSSGFFVTALIKSAFKVSNAELETQKNAMLAQAEVVKQISLDLNKETTETKEKTKATKEETKEKQKSLDITKETKREKEEIAFLDMKISENSDKYIRSQIALYTQLRDIIDKDSELYIELGNIIDGLNTKLKGKQKVEPIDFSNALKDLKPRDNKKAPTLFTMIFGTPKENESEQDRVLRMAQGASKIINELSSYGSQIAGIASQAINIQAENDLRTLEDKRKKGLISEKQYEKESARIKNEAAEKQRAVQIAMAVAQIPQAILSAYVSAAAVPGGFIIAPIIAGIAGAFAAAQVAIIAAAPLPKFKQGGQVSEKLGLIKGRSHSDGGVPIEVEGDEYVMPVAPTRKNIKALKAIHDGTFEKLFIPKNDLMRADIFANIPNPAKIDSPILFDKDDYSSINSRLDKLANETWWMAHYIKEGNKSRNVGTEKIVKNLERSKRRYV